MFNQFYSFFLSSAYSASLILSSSHMPTLWLPHLCIVPGWLENLARSCSHKAIVHGKGLAHTVCSYSLPMSKNTCFFRDRIGSISVCYLQRSASFANEIDSTRVIIWLELLVCDFLRMIFLIQCCINTKLTIFQNKY